MSYSAQEKAYFDKLFIVVDKEDAGVLPGQDALPFFMSASLPQHTLGEIWALADPENNGFLTRDAWYRAARLIGWAQSGSKVDEASASKSGPLPTFTGQPPPPIQTATTPSVGLPQLSSSDRTKFTRIFVGCAPQNGLISGDKARDVFVKSQLSYDKLGQIWNLSDTQQRGSLDLPDFIIGMYLIQSCMASPDLALPASLPTGVYEAASGGRPAPTSPISRQSTGSNIRAQYTGVVQPQYTGQSVSSPRKQTPTAPWDVSPEGKAASDQFFAQLDTQRKGVIDGDIAVPFMIQSQLDEASLASIWDLADIQHRGKLDRDEFAVAMHLINAKLSGKDIPLALPNSLIPPALRDRYGSQEVLSGPSTTTKDLFDLDFDDQPSASQPAPPQVSVPTPSLPPSTQSFASAFLPQPPSRRSTGPTSQQLSPGPQASATRTTPVSAYAAFPRNDLLGDDTTDSSVFDNTAEIKNKQNQIDIANRDVGDLQKTRGDLEKSVASSAAALEEMEAKLASARSTHETETKAVADLRTRVDEQQSRLKQNNTDVISAESGLSAMRSEKDELEQALLHDREEVRALQKRMKELEDERQGLRLVLDKLRKDGRQQKGMVTIAKKQVSTAESARDSLQQEFSEAEMVSPGVVPPTTLATAAGVPIPSTPKVLSPTPTGTSQRSNNPFDRLGRTRTPLPEESSGSTLLMGAGGAIEAAAGVVAAGASTLYEAAKGVVQPSTSPAADETNTPGAAHDIAHASTDSTIIAKSPILSGASNDDSVIKTDSFGLMNNETPMGIERDPFGSARQQGFDDTSPGFNDSFTAASGAVKVPNLKVPQGSSFESEFQDFEEPVSAPIAPTAITPGMPKSALPADLRPNNERSDSTQVIAPSSVPHSPVVGPLGAGATEELASSDEEDGPEDLDRPQRGFSGRDEMLTVHSPEGIIAPATTSISSAPVEELRPRRSAPPPPSNRSTAKDDFDPFGASPTDIGPSHASDSLPTSAAPVESIPSTFVPGPGPTDPAVPLKTAQFDEDDDFDFSDLPPAQVDQGTAAPPKASFDDEFAGFDDEFENSPHQVNTGSSNSNMSKSYEIVPPYQTAEGASTSHYDEWGMGPHQLAAPLAAPLPTSFSFDDAFGGDFEPAHAAPTQATTSNPQNTTPSVTEPQYNPPSEALPNLEPPSLRGRRQSTAQADDLEDVKKLCAMGFPRSLVIEGLEANGYDFQKTLNVLLVK